MRCVSCDCEFDGIDGTEDLCDDCVEETNLALEEPEIFGFDYDNWLDQISKGPYE